jgi:hypothetical protein
MALSLLKSPRFWKWGVLAVVAAAPLWYLTSYPRGALMARIYHARGHYEVQAYGFPPPWQWQYAKLLKERYCVRLHPVAGCVVTNSLVWYADGYNVVSEFLLMVEYERDIFAECAALARRQVKQEEKGDGL